MAAKERTLGGEAEAALLVQATVDYADVICRRYGEGHELAEAHALCDAAFDLWTAIVLPEKRVLELGLVTAAP